MSIVIIAVGKLKGASGYLSAGVEDYLKRISSYRKIHLLEVPEETITPTRTSDQVKDKEGERILSQLAQWSGPGHTPWIIGLSERGQEFSSESFAHQLLEENGSNQPNGGIRPDRPNPIIFIVGGPLGMSQAVLNRCHWVLSLSRMTFPHPMVRLILLEQLYRAFKIHRQEPYHK